jgi:hypothetical protein
MDGVDHGITPFVAINLAIALSFIFEASAERPKLSVFARARTCVAFCL